MNLEPREGSSGQLGKGLFGSESDLRLYPEDKDIHERFKWENQTVMFLM